VLHGALQPTAILLDRRSATSSSPGEPKLTNFGMYQKRDPRLLPLDDVAYIAPEIAQGYASTDRSDLYALGVILYEICTGALPFQGETSSDVLMQHIHSAPTSPILVNPQIRPALTGVLIRGLAKDPAARFSSATALVTAVEKALNMSVSLGQSHPSLSAINPPSFSDISGPLDAMNSRTYVSPLPRQVPFQSPPSSQSLQSPPAPPAVASSNTPGLPPPPVMPSSTPVLSVTPTGSIPTVQPTEIYGPTYPPQASGSYPVISKSGSMPAMAPPSSQPQQVLPPPTPVQASSTSKRRRRGLFIALLVLLLVALLGSGIATYLVYTHTFSPLPQTIVGHAFFGSSGLISQTSNQGITDKIQINLQHVSDAQPGKHYYAWLSSERQPDVPALALGPLSVNNGQVTLSYSDPRHNNLLANYSRFLITEEDANQQPAVPSLDANTWRYYAAFSRTPNPADLKHYSLLDHLRHLLSQDPKLRGVGLTGGLDIWLFRNTTKILEAAGSARDAQKVCAANPSKACTDGMLRQVARILDYLDGAAYVQTENIPPDIQGSTLLINPTIARVALLEFDPIHQEPPGYLAHIGTHLQEISQISSATASQHALAIQINQAINNVQGWLDAVHADASKLIHMSSTQLLQPDALTILNDLFTQANNAFVGQIDPNTNNVKDGVVQIHYNIQSLATFDITPCTMNNGQSSCA
jgi:eukaryotic-like serine/threonine-protein kinase